MKNGQYSADPSDYLKAILQIGDGAMQDFQDLATSVAGTNDRASLEVLKESTNYIVSLQQWYIHHLLRFFTSPFDVFMPASQLQPYRSGETGVSTMRPGESPIMNC